MCRVDRRSRFLVISIAAGILWHLAAAREAVGGTKTGLCATVAKSQATVPYVGIVSAFPAELAPLVAATRVEQTLEIDGRTYYLGRLDGVRVVLTMTGIGLINADRRTNALLDNFEIAALLMSGAAGSRHRVGDVVLATEWTERNGLELFNTNRALLALAQRAKKRVRPGSLETCTPVPPTDPEAPVVCLPYDPAVILEGHGYSDDPFGTNAFPCTPGAGDVLGCELPQAPPAGATTRTVASGKTRAGASAATAITAAAIAEDLVDMETAAVARVTLEHGVPFLGIRAVSDGAGDPLGEDRSFYAQFFDYYRLSAENAAAVTRAVTAELARLARKRSARPICRLLAKGRWRRAAAGIGAPTPAPASGSGY